LTWSPLLPCFKVRTIEQTEGPEVNEGFEEVNVVQGNPVTELNLCPCGQTVSVEGVLGFLLLPPLLPPVEGGGVTTGSGPMVRVIVVTGE
jgi:hypothetical protein